MYQLLKQTVILTLVIAAVGLTALAGPAEALDGKWTASVENEWGVKQTVQLELKQQKFIYRVRSENGQTELYAKGDFALKSLKPFNVVEFTNIQGGGDEYSLEPINEDRTALYLKDYSRLTLALNFDALRYDDPPRAVTFSKVKE